MEILLIIFFIILLFFGGKFLPRLMRGIGEGMSAFKKETSKDKKKTKDED